MTDAGHVAPTAIRRLDVSRDLQALRADLEEQRRFRVRQLADLEGATWVDSTRPDDDPRNEVTLALTAAAVSVLTAVEAALNRLERNCYGLCLGCGAAISLERLQSLPMVSLCMTCQRKQENNTDPSGQRCAVTEAQPRL